MKIEATTTISKSVGNVIPNDRHIIEAERLVEHNTHYSVFVHCNREILYSKKYWSVRMI